MVVWYVWYVWLYVPYLHARSEKTGQDHGRRKIGLEHRVEIFKGYSIGARDPEGASGIVHEDIHVT